VLALIFGLKHAAQHGFSGISTLSIVLGLALGGVFVRRQRKLADPLIDLRLFRAPAFSASLAVYMLGTFVAFGIFVFMTQYLLLALEMGPLEAGLWTVPFALGYILITQVSAAHGPGLLVTGMVLQSIGLAPVFTLTNDLIMSAAPPERAGAASGISETSSELGGALGIALFGSLATVVYGAALDRATVTQALELTAAVCAGLTAAMVAAIVVLLRPAQAPSRA